MSIAVGSHQGLSPTQLRSSTPLRRYLESMCKQGEEPDLTPPRSIIDAEEYRNLIASPRSIQYTSSARSKSGDDAARSNADRINEEDVEDVESNVQQGLRSENGDPPHEPGPTDPPGPKYESYDSGPSFGNRGPLPPDDHFSPGWTHGVPWNQDIDGNSVTLTQGVPGYAPSGFTSGYPAKVPLPASEYITSPRPPTVNINVDVTKSPSQGSRALSKGSRAVANEGETPLSPKVPSRSHSRAGSNRPEVEQAPMSPLSVKSKQMTKVGTEKGTVYPPLPESRLGDGDIQFDILSSPKARSYAKSKAHSLAPSDSLSQTKVPYTYKNGANGSVLSGGGGAQGRPFSPYRLGPTYEDLTHAAVRGRALPIPELDESPPTEVQSARHSKALSATPSHPSQARHSKAPSAVPSVPSHAPSQTNKPPTQVSGVRAPSMAPSRHSQGSKIDRESNVTPTPARPHSPLDLDQEEAKIVQDALASRTPRTSIYASTLDPDATGHYHDLDLCVLLHEEGIPDQHDVVKRALRKAIKQRIKKLGMKYDNESINQFKKSYHDHDPSVHIRPESERQEPPRWAADLKREIVIMQQRIESLGPKIENLRSPNQSFNNSRFAYEGDDFTHTPVTQTVNIQTQATGTMAESMYPGTERNIDTRENSQFEDVEARSHSFNPMSHGTENRNDSPGQQLLKEELYRVHMNGNDDPSGSQVWELTPVDPVDAFEGEAEPSGLPTIPDTNGNNYEIERVNSPPLPALPDEANQQIVRNPHQGDTHTDEPQPPPWQRIQARLLSWAIIWPLSEVDLALNSTTRGHQVDEVALSIWATQAYKRYVRARLTDSPQGPVDRLFVPPNVADAINNAVFNGRHGDACGMLRDMWTPFGFESTPRLLIVLAKHRGDENHWVVHRFSLPDGMLSTYDSYPERTLPDGRPLGWWFAIRLAWPDAQYPSPEHLMQRTIRLHRPLQLAIDNSVSAAGVWRNLLMGSRPERSLDLERLRDLVNTEVKNLRQRKLLGKLSIGPP
ncbi:hypothetical protein M378DRAFT_186118 [Amanita muscaria Koide BX008]|uniref:Uncharacterized protein n=1 Tax=Amanita muscaria (strain Koide BX008) TaxID=946122 RepID=A0A0C2SSL4_AMAMK|nr:hypothetical protein M378DRAFT_186118 [Amanita muscaria Koide BX008]